MAVAKLLSSAPVATSLARTCKEAVRRGVNVGVDLCFPPRCAMCLHDLPESPADDVLLCDACRTALVPNAAQPRCRSCGASLESPAAETASTIQLTAGRRCRRCRRSKFRFDGVVCLGGYADEMRHAILRMKRPEKQTLTAAVAALLWQVRHHQLTEIGADCVIPVPMHWTRRLLRGSNSAETLGHILARRMRIPCFERALYFRRKVSLQSGLSQSSRIANVRGALAVRAGYDLSGARVLLVDDVLTTGATCNEAARRLIQAKAAGVTVAVGARSEVLDF